MSNYPDNITENDIHSYFGCAHPEPVKLWKVVEWGKPQSVWYSGFTSKQAARKHIEALRSYMPSECATAKFAVVRDYDNEAK